MSRLVLVFAALFASGCHDPCDEESCLVILDRCEARFTTEPDYEGCSEKTATGASIDRMPYCTAACETLGAHDFVQCALDNLHVCDHAQDQMRHEAISEFCAPHLFPNLPEHCARSCGTSRESCEARCGGDFFACIDCSEACGLAQAECLVTCNGDR